jgi:hypothetical protein
MAGGEAISTEVPSQTKQVREFDSHVAPNAGDGSPPAQIFIGELINHCFAKAAFVIENIMCNADAIGHGARIANVLPCAAAAHPTDSLAMIIQLERDPDRFCSRARRKGCNHRRIDSAGHGDNDPARLRRAVELEKIEHDEALSQQSVAEHRAQF